MQTSSKSGLWAGRIISALVAIFLLVDGAVKLTNIAPVREAHRHLGYPEELAVALGTLLLTCTILYVIPRTSVLGAILLTGYLGGATATHVRIADPFYFPIVFGALLWLGLWLRDESLRAFIPVRRQPREHRISMRS